MASELFFFAHRHFPELMVIYQEHELRELNQKKMIILIPFQMLKLKQLIGKKKNKQEILQNLILHDILGSIKEQDRI